MIGFPFFLGRTNKYKEDDYSLIVKKLREADVIICCIRII